MASLGKIFDQEVTSDFPSIPNGWYPLKIISAEIKEKNEKTYMTVTLVVTEGQYAKRRVSDFAYVSSPDAKDEEMGVRKIAGIRAALGIAKLTATEQLVGRELIGELTHKPAKNGYGEGNYINKYKSISGSAIPSNFATIAAQKISPDINSDQKTQAPARAPWQKKIEVEQDIF